MQTLKSELPKEFGSSDKLSRSCAVADVQSPQPRCWMSEKEG